MNKKNDKFFIILASLVLIVTIVIFIILNINKNNNNDKISLPKDEIEIAELMLVPNKNSLQLVNMEGNILDIIEGDIKFNVSDTDEVMYEKNNALYTVEINKTINDENDEIFKLSEKEILKSNEKIDSFIFDENYIAILSKTKYINNEVVDEEYKESNELLEEKEINKDYECYNITFFDRTTNKKVNTLNNVFVNNMVLNDNHFIYNVSNYLYSFEIKNNKTNELYLGKEISDIDIVNKKIIVFNKFGNSENKSLILQIDSNLTVDKASKHEASNLIEIQKDINEKNIIYIENDKTPLFYMLNLDEDREVKKKTNLNVNLEGIYNENNTIYSKGYIYTAKDGKLNIIDLKSSTIYKSYDIEASFVYPIYLDLENDTIETTK